MKSDHPHESRVVAHLQQRREQVSKPLDYPNAPISLRNRPSIPPRAAMALLCLALTCLNAPAATHYVWQDSPSPGPPYADWSTAAHTIQDAVDAAQSGETVLVTNGVYSAGGRSVGTSLLVNRVAIDKAITVLSVNGPEVTIIQGARAPGGTNGDGAIRCVYLADGASLSGFTLTNGATRVWPEVGANDLHGGGVWCESTNAMITNCVIARNSADSDGGGAFGGTLSNCTLTDNSADYGGGAYGGTLNHCTLAGNSAHDESGGGVACATLNHCLLTGNFAVEDGGGAFQCTLHNCTLIGNSTFDSGGGAAGSTLNNCLLSGNSAAYEGGGADCSTLHNCTLTGNSASYGGGAYGGTLHNCTLADNSAIDAGGAWGSTLLNCLLKDNLALYSGGGVCEGTLNNCTVVGNSAGVGGGTLNSTLRNCIVYDNTAPSHANYWGDAFAYSCTSPLPEGFGNIDQDPAFINPAAGDFRLRFGSPCVDAGMDLSGLLTTDLDGNPRPRDGNGDGKAAFDMGSFELVPGLVRYVWSNSPRPSPPYTSWSTAAHTIQQAVDAAQLADTVLVTNGVYATGGRTVGSAYLTNRVVIDKPITLLSANGPKVTFIEGAKAPGGGNGDGAIRCVYLANGASVSGFTLTNGATRTTGDWEAEQSGGGASGGTLNNCILTGNSAAYGGGASCCALYNCTLTGNSASKGGGAFEGMLNNCTLTGNSAYQGGGVSDSALNNCTLTGNSATYEGGGAYRGTLKNCTLTGNSAQDRGGGVWADRWSRVWLYNCIVYFNSAPLEPNYGVFTAMDYCCTVPMPTNGVGNLTNTPLFVDYPGGNLRLQSNSPCINTGNNNYVTTSTDLDGRPRVVGGTIDMGAYEHQGPGVSEFIGWLQRYELPTGGSADFADPDGDGHTTWQEWTADTDPIHANSVLRIQSITPGPPVTISLQSSAARLYTLQSCADLCTGHWTPVSGQTDVPGTGGLLTLSDANAGPSRFYRISVGMP